MKTSAKKCIPLVSLPPIRVLILALKAVSTMKKRAQTWMHNMNVFKKLACDTFGIVECENTYGAQSDE